MSALARIDRQRRGRRRAMALVAAVAATAGVLVAASPAAGGGDASRTMIGSAVAPAGAGGGPQASPTIIGSAVASSEHEWFNKTYDTGERYFGKVRGRVRFVTDTGVQLDSIRTISSVDQGDLDAGQ